MIESWFFVLAMLAVLLIPGPTNALFASAAHHQGITKTASFIPAEWLGYLYGIAIWALLIHLGQPIWPALTPLLHVISALYVIWLAFNLWKSSHLQKHSQSHKAIRPKQIFFSTLKNPKALLFAAGIFPPETWDSLEHAILVLGVFSLILFPVSWFWMVFGRALLAGNIKGLQADRLYKGSAMLLLLCMLPVIFRFF
ncbi:LysE family transporter [Acinetobacter ursingii]|uniref:LysE family translocator n=1 Tax=Acinetobacter ursingii TaxID=108980 RepID=UPI00124EEEB7|nr:LysE family transporter [Acinetobacter ursingii]MCU4306689.1 LysE family transporter [Acinetobacter ursingii]MCU4372841.1 LysE family transporter [Acinetobacter ursingii]MCU4382396.1 LysE family transporter [Acinetobacter ursingii]MDG9993162.1 LysE family transporter [Acinetobacter ursingii]MDU4394795.1 LysE family transporter [Acinetobacter ursingii]